VEGWAPREGDALPYRVDTRFGLDMLPAGASFGQVSAVATDSEGNVFVFQRGPRADPIVVFDPRGRFIRSWNGGVSVPHGLRIGPDASVWITDVGLHCVLKFDRHGRLLMTLGTPGRAGADESTFDRPTDVAFGPGGDVYVSDGYGNSRIVRFDARGRFVSTWGRPGSGPGEFATPHTLATDASGRVYVSDRANERIQIFDSDGSYLTSWTHLGATQGIDIPPGADEAWVITFRSLNEIIEYDSMPGKLMRVKLSSGQILGSMEAPGHWVHQSAAGEIFVGSLTGNVIRLGRPEVVAPSAVDQDSRR
jgi:DNA-binding beta-propeller fold protein YncE